MKLNLNYYKEDLNYDKLLTLNYENEIKEKYFNEENVFICDEKLQQEFEVEKISHLLSIEKNILEWYEFNENATVLEIGAKLGGITSLLSEKCKEVTAIEFSKQRGEIISKRLKNNENVQVIIGNLQDINLEDAKYDYVVLIGILEYAPLFFKSENPYLDFLRYAKNNLKPNGKILLAIDNPFGVQYIVGNKCELNIQAFETLENNNSPKLLSKNDIENILKTLDINNFKFYYPLPNYKFTNVIFSDDYLPLTNDTKIMYNLIYNNNSKILLDERKVMKKCISAGMFKYIANSYFAEISLDSQLQKSKFVSYNVLRNKKYNLMTTLDNKVAIKRGVNLEANSHIKNISKNIEELNKYGINIIDKYEENKIVSEIFNSEQFDQFLIKLYNEFKIEQFYDEIKSWYNHIKNKLLNAENFIRTENKLNFLKKCYIDLVFENTFYENEKYYFFDQEWVLEDCPVEYILYRAFKNLISYNDLNIDFDYLLNKFEILEFKNEFEKYEIKLQEEVNDSYMIKLFSKAYTFKRNIENVEYNFESLKKEIENNNIKIEQLLEEKKEINSKVNEISQNNIELKKYKENLLEERNYLHAKIEEIETIKNNLENDKSVLLEELGKKSYENLPILEIVKRKIKSKIKKGE